jgi:hypothetical protein
VCVRVRKKGVGRRAHMRVLIIAQMPDKTLLTLLNTAHSSNCDTIVGWTSHSLGTQTVAHSMDSCSLIADSPEEFFRRIINRASIKRHLCANPLLATDKKHTQHTSSVFTKYNSAPDVRDKCETHLIKRAVHAAPLSGHNCQLFLDNFSRVV